MVNVAGGKLDCYIKEDRTGIQTKTVLNVENTITWEQDMMIPIRLPIMTESIKVGLWDKGDQNLMGV